MQPMTNKIELIKPACMFHHLACPCYEWEHLRIRNELTQANARIAILEAEYQTALETIKALHEIASEG